MSLRASGVFADFQDDYRRIARSIRIDLYLELASIAEEAKDIEDAEAYFTLAMSIEDRLRRRRSGASCYW